MGVLEQIIYGFLSGITEILPVSSQAHQSLMLMLFGQPQRIPLLDLVVHFAILLAVVFGCYSNIARLRRDIKTGSRYGRALNRNNSQQFYEIRLLRTAVLPLCIGISVYLALSKLESSLIWIAVLWIINGTVLYIAGHMRQGNKAANTMSGMDAIGMGLIGGLSAVPGISRTGMITSFCAARGAGRNHALNWALLLSIPALAVYMIIDIIGIISIGIGLASFAAVIGCLLASAAAFAGAYISIIFVQFIIVRFDLSGFSYYCWGIALLTFIMYLII